MERKELKKRTKGLLALVLAFVMLYGMSMTALANGYAYNRNTTLDDLKADLENKVLESGDTIYFASGDLIEVYMPDASEPIETWCYSSSKYHGKSDGCSGRDGHLTTIGGNGQKFMVKEFGEYKNSDGETCWMIMLTNYPPTVPAAPSQLEASEVTNPTGSSHEHYFQWKETIEPTVTSDGLLENICGCGVINDRVVVPGAMAYFKAFCDKIQNAPENSVVEWNPLNNYCYTRRMMEELAKRPDVTLKTTYTDSEGNVKSFTIPAGQALTDNEMFYGFTYLGNLYGWN